METHFRAGKWISPKGSAFKVCIESNRLLGIYSTSIGRVEPDQVSYASGLINEDLVGLTVAWVGLSSLTTWCGHYEIVDNRECLKAVWYYARMYEDERNTIPLESHRIFHVGQTLFFWEGELTAEEEVLIKQRAAV